MKKIKVINIIVALILLFAASAAYAETQPSGQPQEQPSAQPAPPPAPVANPEAMQQVSKEMYQRLYAIKKDFENKNFDGAKAALREVEGRCLDLGIMSYEELSAAMVMEAKAQLRAKETKAALLLLESAIRISPNYPPPYYARGWAYFAQDSLKSLTALDSFLEGFISPLKDFWWMFFYAGNKFTSLLFTVAALFSLFGLMMALRYLPLLAHDISELLDRRLDENMIKYLALPGFFLLLLVIFGYWWAVAVASVVLWVYFNKRERAVAVLFFVLLVFMPDIMANFANFVQAGSNRLLWVMDEVNKGKLTAGDREYVQDLLRKEPGNEAALMSMAQIEKKEVRYAQAEELYKKLLTVRPSSAIYWNNLGIVHYLQGRPGEAITDFSTAIRFEPRRVLPYFNLSQIYGESLMFTEREKTDLIARELDPPTVARLRDLAGNTPQRMAFDEPAPPEAFWRIAFSGSSQELAESLWQTSVKVLPLHGTRLAGVSFIVLAFGINAFRLKRVHAHFCKKCGKVSCKKCQKPYYNKELCPQCHQIFVKLEGVEAKDRVRKMLEVRDIQQKRGLMFRISSLIMPGSGHFMLGHPLRGMVFGGVFIFILKDVFFGRFFEVPYDFRLPFIRPDMMALILILVVFYIIAQLDMHRKTE